MRIRPDYHRRVKFFFDLGIEGKGEGRERERYEACVYAARRIDF